LQYASAAVFLPGPQIFTAGLDSELFRNRQNRIGVSPAAIIGHDDPVLSFAAHAAFPSVVAQILSNAVQGVFRGKQVDAAIAIRINAKDRDIGRHELAKTDGAVNGSGYLERIETVALRIANQ
jgi:hypothetical protein